MGDVAGWPRSLIPALSVAPRSVTQKLTFLPLATSILELDSTHRFGIYTTAASA